MAGIAMNAYEIRYEIWKEANAYHQQKYNYDMQAFRRGEMDDRPSVPTREEILETARYVRDFVDTKE